MEVDEPCLPRRCRLPKRFDDGTAACEYPKTPEEEYRRVYFEALDLAVTRFDQPGFKTFSTVEQLVLKAAKGEPFGDKLDGVCSFFGEDFDSEELAFELATFKHLYEAAAKDTASSPSVECVGLHCLLSSSQRALIGNVCRFFKLLLILPATNSTSEHSFSML